MALIAGQNLVSDSENTQKTNRRNLSFDPFVGATQPTVGNGFFTGLRDLSSNLVFNVVDSAAFKQGKYTPVTHIPIVSPSALVLDPVDAIIVMAASYSDEIARNIRQKFDANIKVAILRDFGLEVV